MSAIAQLLGMRLITEIASPASFGAAMLAIGASMLIASIIANPAAQAIIKFHPVYSAEGADNTALHLAIQQARSWSLYLVTPGMALMAVTIHFSWVSIYGALLILLLACTELFRTIIQAKLNAEQKHTAFGKWTVVDSILKPLIAVGIIMVMGDSSQGIILGYALGGAICLAIFCRTTVTLPNKDHSDSDNHEKARLFRNFCLPLIPLGLLGWVAGMTDRYVIAGLISPAEAGIYIAVAGLAAKPMLMGGNVLELYFRPKYQLAHAAGNAFSQKRIIRSWMGLILAAGSIASITGYLLHDLIASSFLGEAFRVHSSLLPILVGAYIPLLLSYVFARVCYAASETKAVLKIHIIATCAVLILSPTLIFILGIKGAPVALLMAHIIQLIAAWYFCHATREQAN